MGIYSKSALPESDLKRNTFDLSFQNNLTTNFGVLKPVFFKEVLPGDTWDIDTTFGFRFMPTVFPIQNRAKASVKFFYVRTRSLYEDFKEWSTGNDEKLDGLPYLNPTYGQTTSMFRNSEDIREFFKNGGIADSLGLPVTQTIPSGTAYTANLTTSSSGASSPLAEGASVLGVSNLFPLALTPKASSDYADGSVTLDSLIVDESTFVPTPYLNNVAISHKILPLGDDQFELSQSTGTSLANWASSSIAPSVSFPASQREQLVFAQVLYGRIGTGAASSPLGLVSNWIRFCQRQSGLDVTFKSVDHFLGLVGSSDNTATNALFSAGSELYSYAESKGYSIYPALVAPSSANSAQTARLYCYAIGDPMDRTGELHIKMPTVNYDDIPPSPVDLQSTILTPVLLLVWNKGSFDAGNYGTVADTVGSWNTSGFTVVSYSTYESFCQDPSSYLYTRFLSSVSYTQSINIAHLVSQGSFTTTGIPWFNNEEKISALPFRAYELVYNAFYRDERNNPFQIDGVSYYDKFLPTTKGGADTTRYELHHVNWEQDQFTTALPSPQQGAAPLVGISSTGVATVVDTDGTPVQVQLETADDGDTVVSYSQTSDLSPSVQRTLVNAATSGISINDFRAVNALQRYLEKNLRQGLRYKDMIQSRWGVSPSYSELNMPEFIGGVVEDVIPAQVNNNNGSSTSEPLGSYAGQLYCQGSSKHKIHKFCDEPGYIIGILDVTPVPVYNSLLPKHFRKFDVLDYFNPEFGHIGYQPIRLGELAPNTIHDSNTSHNMNTIFGYQRAWYEYLSSNDEVHGDFRGSLRDFVIYRDFVNPPTLSEEFLTVSDDETNNVFSVQTDADGKEIDKILGQLYFDVKVKRPIPRFGIPRLE